MLGRKPWHWALAKTWVEALGAVMCGQQGSREEGKHGHRGPKALRGTSQPLPVVLQVNWAVCPSGTLVTSSKPSFSIVGGTRRSEEVLTTNQGQPLGCTTAEQEAESPRLLFSALGLSFPTPWRRLSQGNGFSGKFLLAEGLSEPLRQVLEKSPPFHCVWVPLLLESSIVASGQRFWIKPRQQGLAASLPCLRLEASGQEAKASGAPTGAGLPRT